MGVVRSVTFVTGANKIFTVRNNIHAVPARPSVKVGCRQGKACVSEGVSVMARGLLGCAEGKRDEFCLCLVGSGTATFWYLLEGCVVERKKYY